MKGMPIRNGYYVLAQQLRGEIILAPNTTKKFNVKSMERKHRDCSEKLIVTGETTKKPPDWKTFLANEENKKQLIELCRVYGVF
jgi:hypothetical protein